jgi:hypothetical protein
MLKPANTVTKATGGKYTCRLRQAEQQLLAKQAELQNAQRDVVDSEELLQVNMCTALRYSGRCSFLWLMVFNCLVTAVQHTPGRSPPATLAALACSNA